MLQDGAGRERDQTSTAEPSPLAGKLFESSGERLTPSHAVKGGRQISLLHLKLSDPGHEESSRYQNICPGS